MLTEPRDLDRAELERLLERWWGLRDPTLDYLPVGFGSHHWRCDSRGTHSFVSVDDLEAGFQAGPDADAAFTALDRAFRTAASLRDDAGLEFVVAPLADDDGLVLRRLSDRYAIRVSPLVEGDSSGFGAYETPEDRRRMGAVLGRLHAATEHVPAGLPRRDDLELPSRCALEEALHDLDRPWGSGPFGEPTRRLDWDTTLIAPRERDLRMVLDDDLTGWSEYSAHAGAASFDQEALRLYRRSWDLADIGIFVAGFRQPHERTEDAAASWDSLADYLRS